jgi:hypothetical protein
VTRADAIEAAIAALLSHPGVAFNGSHRQRQGGTTVIRINFRVTDGADEDALRLRCALVLDVVIPAARQLGLRLQCGDIERAPRASPVARRAAIQ